MRIEPASPDDLPVIHAAYAHGRATQQKVGSTVWPEFGDDAILAELGHGALFRVVDDVGTVAGVFSMAYEDPAIWGDRERGAHLYLHRIARAPEWPGRGLVDGILAWATDRCRALARAGIRIDTWAGNTALIAFYESRGFALIGRRHIGIDARLPPHYHGSEFALLERSCVSRYRD